MVGLAGDKSDWRTTTKQQTLDTLQKQLQLLVEGVPAEQKKQWAQEFDGFTQLFTRYLSSEASVQWSKIEKLGPDTVRPYADLKAPANDKVKDLLNKLVVVKLNGGLGTSMGCKGPKSLIAVRNDLTFLDLTMQQIQHLNQKYEANVPLVLMNSFNTDVDTAKVLPKYRSVQVESHVFNQSRYPRIDKETFQPVASQIAGSSLEDWYPPGHGDFYQAFSNSGLLDKFLAQGKEYVFVSNIDNMGATVDLNIVNFLMTDEGNGGKQPEFLMEVTDKTRADVKGGTLIKYEGSVRLLEIAQVHKDNVDEFKSIQKFSIFNTNNLWAKLQPIKELVSTNKMQMEIIVNPKHLDSGLDVIQLETAAGAAIKNFTNACAVNVPRDRFLPVKKSQDLLLLMSNLYDINNGTLSISKKRQFAGTPLIKLGTSFDNVRNFLSRFQGVPGLLELDHLTVSGDVTFGKSVTLKGTVIIIANHGERIDIPMGSYLENKIVSGNLRILDH